MTPKRVWGEQLWEEPQDPPLELLPGPEGTRLLGLTREHKGAVQPLEP